MGGGGRVVDGEVEAEDGVWNRGERVKQDLSLPGSPDAVAYGDCMPRPRSLTPLESPLTLAHARGPHARCARPAHTH